MEIGAQFYTLRNFCKDLTGLEESLKKVADIGYKNVQISGTCEFEAEWLRDKLKENGLKCVLTHTAPAKLISDIDKVVKEHDIFGCEYVGLGYFPFNEEKEDGCFDYFMKTYLPIAKAVGEKGKYFMYHHHAHEFGKHNQKLIIDSIIESFPKECAGITLDTFWVQSGGADIGFWLEKLSGRVPCIHLKDFAFDRKMSVIGEGNINFARVFKKAEAAGTKYMLVEQDECHGEDPFACLKRSYDYLVSRGFK